MNKSRVKLVLLSLLIFLVAIQLFQPQRTNPPVVPSRSLPAHVGIPADVYSSLLRSCGDCHSSQTHWPWYSRVAPLSWVVIDDVNEGRRHMNLDDWETLESPQIANDRQIDICKEIQEKGMPPFSYRLVHGDVRLNPKEIASICTWSQSFQAGPTETHK